jgi:hypothetical protein
LESILGLLKSLKSRALVYAVGGI